MWVFTGFDANLPTQLWIEGRYLESFSLLIAPLFLRRRLRPWPVITGYVAAVTLLPALLGIFGDHLDRFRVRRPRLDHGGGHVSGWHRWTKHVQRRPWPYLLASVALLATMAVGNIYQPDHANSILAAGRADLVALARPHLIDPFWTLRAAAALDYRDVHIPPQYLNGMSQLARNLKREAEAAAAQLRAEGLE